MNADLIRFIDSISRDKNIEKESVFDDLEAAMVSAARRAYEEAEDVVVQINRVTGDITATVDAKPIDLKDLGRIAAQTAKQVMIQRIREDERNAIFEEYSARVGTVVTGQVSRYEAGGLVINLGRGEGFLPRSEQIPGQTNHPGERIRAMILDVRESPSQVKIVLTQTHPDYIRKLFELEVPEVGERIIEIRALAREAGYRTKIAVSSIDMKVDAVGACVGVRGSRIRNIVDELGGEKVDIVRWNESSQILISNALKPAEVKETFLCFELGRATVVVAEDQLSLAIGKRGQNVRLAARLTGWDIDIVTPAEYNKNVDDMEQALRQVEGVEDLFLDKLLAIGAISLADLAAIGAEPLTGDLGLTEELAARIVQKAEVEAPRLAAEAKAAKVAAAEAAAAAAAEQAAGGAEKGEESTQESEAADDQEAAETVVADGEAEVEPAAEDTAAGNSDEEPVDVPAASVDEPSAEALAVEVAAEDQDAPEFLGAEDGEDSEAGSEVLN